MDRHTKKKRAKRLVKAICFSLSVAVFSGALYFTQIKEVNINYLGKTISFKTMASTVAAAFEEQNIMLGEGEIVSEDLNTELNRNNNILVQKPIVLAMAEPIIKEEVVAPVEVLPVIKEEVKKKAVTPKKATATSRGAVRTTWGPEVNEVEEGVLETSDGQIVEYSAVMQVEATAYCACHECCGKWPGNKWYGITATGTEAKIGTIAVDPRVIPLGTKVYVEGLNGAKNYGYATAEDTGGAIKGDIIDLYFNTHKETVNWGRQQVKVYIIK